MNLQQLIDIKWMLRYNGYKTEDGIKYVRTVGKSIARSVEFKDNKVLIKYINTDTGFKDKKEVLLEDAFNWIT
jgi:hypothetical protein